MSLKLSTSVGSGKIVVIVFGSSSSVKSKNSQLMPFNMTAAMTADSYYRSWRKSRTYPFELVVALQSSWASSSAPSPPFSSLTKSASMIVSIIWSISSWRQVV